MSDDDLLHVDRFKNGVVRRLKAWCSCGGYLSVVTIPDDESWFLLERWRRMHTGAGHSYADAETARKARRRVRA